MKRTTASGGLTALGDAPSGADVWLDVVAAAIGLFRTLPFHEVDLAGVARAAGRAPEEVAESFPGFSDLVIAVVQVWNAERMAPIADVTGRHGAVAFLRAIVESNIADPALMRTLSATVNLAATPGHPLAPLLQQQWLRFHALVQRSLAHDVEVGREPATMEPARGAEQLIALYEGLQLQAMVRPAMDLLGAYDRAVARLRTGWSAPYEAPVWDI